MPWHFDKHYWSSSSSERMLTAFIPFHLCDEQMGTITMIDGSHRWKEIGTDDTVVRHFAERDNDDLEAMLARNAEFNNAEVRKVPMIIPKGHMSFHHCRTYHGSAGNRSDRPRRAISFHLQDGENAFQDTRSATAAWPGTTTTCSCVAPRTAARTTPTRRTARSSGPPGNAASTVHKGACMTPDAGPTPGGPTPGRDALARKRLLGILSGSWLRRASTRW